MAKLKKPLEMLRDPTSCPLWVLTFSDMMSQLLLFFIVLFSVSEVKQEKVYDMFVAFRTAFKMDIPQSGYTLKSFEESMAALSEYAFNVPDQQGELGRSDIAVPERFGKYMKVEKKDESLTMSIAAETFFEKGSAVMGKDQRDVLQFAAEKLAGYWTRIKVLGVTSPAPLPPGSPHQDHFALGYARAKAVAEELAGNWRAGGRPMEEARLEISSRGCYDQPDNPLEERLYDRVEIIVTAEPVMSREKLKGLETAGTLKRDKDTSHAAKAASKDGKAEAGEK